MKTYKLREAPTVQAEQFLPPYQIPEGVSDVYDLGGGVYSGQTYNEFGYRMTIRSKDWVIKVKSDGMGYRRMKDGEFNKKYQLID